MRDACLVSRSQKTLDNRSIDNHWGLVQSPPSFILETVCTLRIFQGTVLVSKIRKLLPQHPLSTHSIHSPRLPEKLRVVSKGCAFVSSSPKPTLWGPHSLCIPSTIIYSLCLINPFLNHSPPRKWQCSTVLSNGVSRNLLKRKFKKPFSFSLKGTSLDAPFVRAPFRHCAC